MVNKALKILGRVDFNEIQIGVCVCTYTRGVRLGNEATERENILTGESFCIE